MQLSSHTKNEVIIGPNVKWKMGMYTYQRRSYSPFPPLQWEMGNNLLISWELTGNPWWQRQGSYCWNPFLFLLRHSTRLLQFPLQQSDPVRSSEHVDRHHHNHCQAWPIETSRDFSGEFLCSHTTTSLKDQASMDLEEGKVYAIQFHKGLQGTPGNRELCRDAL